MLRRPGNPPADPLPARRLPPTRRTTAATPASWSTPSGLLCDGPIRGLFDRPSSITADLDTPALSLDISALDDDEDDVVAAAMLCSWAWSAAVIDGSPPRSAAGGAMCVQVQDELWRALRVAPGLVERSDRITRLGRHRGVVSFQVTHSLDDLEALPTEADRAKARGMAARNAILVLGGMADAELDGSRRITPLTEQEAALVASWAAPPTWHTGTRHPGRGKYLIKSGERLGLPVALPLTPTERTLYDTDQALHHPSHPARHDQARHDAASRCAVTGPSRAPLRLTEIAAPLVLLGILGGARS